MMWITYKTVYGKEYSQMDYDPNSYTDVAIFNVELDALRYANQHGAKCIPIESGQSLENAIKVRA